MPVLLKLKVILNQWLMRIKLRNHACTSEPLTNRFKRNASATPSRCDYRLRQNGTEAARHEPQNLSSQPAKARRMFDARTPHARCAQQATRNTCAPLQASSDGSAWSACHAHARSRESARHAFASRLQRTPVLIACVLEHQSCAAANAHGWHATALPLPQFTNQSTALDHFAWTATANHYSLNRAYMKIALRFEVHLTHPPSLRLCNLARRQYFYRGNSSAFDVSPDHILPREVSRCGRHCSTATSLGS